MACFVTMLFVQRHVAVVCMDLNPRTGVTGEAFISSNSLFGRDLKLADFLLEAFDD